MFKIDMGAIRQSAAKRLLTANPANPANELANFPEKLAALAALAVSSGKSLQTQSDFLPHEAKRLKDLQVLFWPKSPGMAASETATLAQRTQLFMRRGMATVEAEQLAFKLTDRDRDMDSRRLCLECANLARAGGWRCGNWRAAAVGSPGVPDDLVRQLQHCPGFTNSLQVKKATS